MPDGTPPSVSMAPVWRFCPTDQLPLPGGAEYPEALPSEASRLVAQSDNLAEEIPVALEYNGISHATLLCSPSNLDALALGFSFTEGIIRGPSDLYDIEHTSHPNGITLHITIASACHDQLKRRRRSLAGTTGCGLCGLESLSDVERMLPPVAAPTQTLDPEAILRACHALAAHQPLHRQTGATHGAGWATPDGNLAAVMEDVGRHNALDKLIGQRLKESANGTGSAFCDGFVVMSSRASFEIIQKAAAAGIGAVVAVSAPTAYAVERAQKLNLLLIGFARPSGFTVYAHPEHLHRKETVT